MWIESPITFTGEWNTPWSSELGGRRSCSFPNENAFDFRLRRGEGLPTLRTASISSSETSASSCGLSKPSSSYSSRRRRRQHNINTAKMMAITTIIRMIISAHFAPVDMPFELLSSAWPIGLTFDLTSSSVFSPSAAPLLDSC